MSTKVAALAAAPPRTPRRSRNAQGLRRHADASGWRLAQAAFVLGMLFALVSAYWASGGMWLLGTVGRGFEEQARSGNAALTLAGWSAAILKLIASVLPLLAIRRRSRPAWNRCTWGLAWLAAAFLTLYGLVLTTASLLGYIGVIHGSTPADHRTLAWHAYLWDPWFLIWGLLVTAALLRGRRSPGAQPPTRS